MKNSVLVIVSIALAPGWALAQNGVVLINQSTVAASGANRSTGGFPYVIMQPGSYQLSSNLTLPADVNAIVIAASFVSLDLNGFIISNPSCAGHCTNSGITDNGTQQSGITIRGGTVFGFYNGISLNASIGSFIEKVTAQSNSNDGIAVFNSSTVKDCVALSNGGTGIAAGYHNIVSGSVALGNGAFGISVEIGTLTGNTADSNVVGGIEVGGGNSTLTGNTASNNIGTGLDVGPGSTATGNTASGNGTGFLVFCPSNLVGNTAVDTAPANLVGAGCNKVNNLGF